jgi:hypothetical protein
MNTLVLHVVRVGEHNELRLPDNTSLREISILHSLIKGRMERGESISVVRGGAVVQRLKSVPRSIVCPMIEIVGENRIFPNKQGSGWSLPFAWSLPADCFNEGDEIHFYPVSTQAASYH